MEKKKISSEKNNGMSIDFAIEASGLVRHYGKTRAVNGVDLLVPARGVYGLLGPNGAGKTTVIRVLATLIRPDSGAARVLGHDIVTEGDAVRSKVSLTGQFASVDDDITCSCSCSPFLFGGAIAGSVGQYLQFLLPGILVQTVVMITIYTGVAINNDIRKGVFDRFRSLPVWQPSVLVGALLGDAVRYSIASLVMIALGLMLGFRPEGGASGVLLAIMLLLVFSFSFSWIWTSLGFIVRTQESLFTMSFIVLFPLTFASNIFVDPQTMPSWLETFVNVNPISILVTAMRGLMHGEPVWAEIGLVLLVSAGLVSVFGPVTMYLFENKE
ncbi:MAG: ABC transporter permease [Balneolales bacterium]